MKRLVFILVLATFAISPAKERSASVQLGVYDYIGNFASEKLSYELFFIDWTKTTNVSGYCRIAASRGRIPIVSVEPHAFGFGGGHLLPDIISGKYDAQIVAIARSCTSGTIIRWGHEFDLRSNAGRYPWACKPCNDYIAAFRRVVTVSRQVNSLLKFMWSPGDDYSSCLGYYPGSAYVDYVGCSLYSRGWIFGRGASFEAIMGYRYHDLARLGKPIFVAELGVNFDQARWLQAAFASTSRFPQLKALIYFNANDDFDNTDWRVPPQYFRS
jgi:beta-mannanase